MMIRPNKSKFVSGKRSEKFIGRVGSRHTYFFLIIFFLEEI